MARYSFLLALVVMAAAFGTSIAATNTTSNSTKPVVKLSYTKNYSSFYSGLTWTANSTTCKGIVDALGLKTTLSNPALALTIFVPSDQAFNALAAKYKITQAVLAKNTGLMKSIMYYHFVTGSKGVKQTFHSTQLTAGLSLDTMYTSALTKKAYTLTVASVTGSGSSRKVQIKALGTSAYINKPNIKCGAGVAHGIDNLLVPMSLSLLPNLGK